VVVDENSAVIPKVKVRLQVPDGKDLRDIEATETDPTGQFSFEAQPSGNYRLVFAGPKGSAMRRLQLGIRKPG
jgi:Carboxypeptidase regulatory-like domain